MKKLLSLILIITMSIILLTGCSTTADSPEESSQESSEKNIQESTQESTTGKFAYKIPDGFRDGYELAEYEKFNSHADENHLNGTKIYDYVTVEDVDSVDGVFYGVCKNKKGKKWLILLNGEQFADISQYSKIVGHSAVITGEYEGYSDTYNLPAYTASKIFDIDTGETIICLNSILENIENATEEEITQTPTEKPTPSPTEPITQKVTEPQIETPTQKPTQPQTQAPVEKPTEAPKPTEVPTVKPTEPVTQAPPKKDEIEILKEYTYSDGFWYTYHFVVVKNISNVPLSIDTSTLAYADDGSLISVGNGSVIIIEPNCATIYYEAFETTKNIARYETTREIEQETYYKYGTKNLSYTQTKIENGEIIQVTNNGTEPIEFVEGYLLYFKNGKIVGWSSNFFTDNDYEIKPGKTISQQYSIYEDYDTTELYLTGRR